MERSDLEKAIETTFGGLESSDLPNGTRLTKGKVRDIIDIGNELLIVTSDRISAFDRVLTTIPFKGQVLNGLSNYWFHQTADIVPNHIRQRLTPRSVAVARCEVVPIEVVVRGYLTGSAWRDYEAGKAVSGIELPRGMRFNQRFEKPLLTPSTKAEHGDHDEPISPEEILRRKLVEPDLWKEIERTAFALFERGTKLAAERGLILVDTKYELGLLDGDLVLVDEVHTPDSSRYWFADTYEELFEAGEKQRKIDKEYLRQWLMEQGFMGDGEPPAIPDEIRANVAERYIQSFEVVTGESFDGEPASVESERAAIVSYLV
jgi:phosphoribosylaminoimidazole-succinocarboxamide synthase